MADNANEVPENDRTVRLSEVEFTPRNYADAYISVDEGSWVARTTRNAGKLISHIGMARGKGAAPTHIQVVRSEKNPTEFALVPTNDESDDYIKLDWYNQGRLARFHVGKLLKLKKMEIPKGTRMVATIFPDTDSKYGNVVGIILNEVEFVAVETKAKGKADDTSKAESKTEPEQEPPASA